MTRDNLPLPEDEEAGESREEVSAEEIANSIPGGDDEEGDGPELQTWRPKQGTGTRIVAWVILAAIAVTLLAMGAVVVMQFRR